jgi:uncharacterized protein (TIGR02246 family)
MEPESLFQTYKTAVLQKDLEAFASIYDENVFVFDTWQQWSYDGLAAWREMAKGWFASLGSDSDVVTFEGIKIQETGNLAMLTAIVKFTAVSEKNEELRYLQNRLTWVAKKNDELWKIIHQHSSSPVDFETMQVILTK